MQGCAKGYGDSYLSRLANAFGTPNIASMSYICFHARLRGMLATYGFMSHPDIDHPPRTIVAWGANLTATSSPEGERIVAAKKRGATLIVIDPAKTAWPPRRTCGSGPVPPRTWLWRLPCSTSSSTRSCTTRISSETGRSGSRNLRQHVQAYTPEVAAGITWVPAEQIEAARARFATGGPAVIYSGNGQDNNINNYQFNRAASILRAITGNLDIPGGEVDWVSPGVEPGGSPRVAPAGPCPPRRARRQRVGAEENVAARTTSPPCRRSWSRPCSPPSPTRSGPPSSKAGASSTPTATSRRCAGPWRASTSWPSATTS